METEPFNIEEFVQRVKNFLYLMEIVDFYGKSV